MKKQLPDENTAIRLMLAYLCVSKEAEASLVRKVQILDRFGLTDGEIGTVCMNTAQSVRNARQVLKKKPNANKKTT